VALTFNVDEDAIQADWLRITARMGAIAAEHPELTEAEVCIAAERAHLASSGGDFP
jgi:hypothetical protein